MLKALVGFLIATLLSAVAGAAELASAPARVILVGDSTLAKGSGYGDALCRHFAPEVTCINAARGGRSTRSYREEGLWASVLQSLPNGGTFSESYVLIQFGHNDQPGKPGRSTSMDEFAGNLVRYVKDVRGAGAIPLLMTPLTRRQFANGKLLKGLEPWAETTRRVAKENGVALLDLHRDSAKLVQSLGSRRSTELAAAPPSPDTMAAALTGTTIDVPKPDAGPTSLPPAPVPIFDYTHLGARGADVFGALVAQEIRAAVPGLARWLSKKAPAPSALAPREINVWRGPAPGGERVTVRQSVVERSKVEGVHDRALIGITEPTLTLYRPAKPDGSAVLIVPGGSYLRVAIDKEGEETARVLNQHGITAAVLVYRLPADGWAAGRDAPLQDAERALRLLRSGSAGALDPKRIGVLGFSAGGDVAAALALRHEAAIYEQTDQADLLSARPDFLMLMYPALDMPIAPPGGATPIQAKLELASLVTSAAPPCFIVHAADDASVSLERSVELFSALRAAQVPAELHVFEVGGHGFGIRLAAGKPVEAWPDLLVRWGREHQFFR
jgi:acetyl esterase/lipase/lysophospholipase L1-like esterase